MKIQMMKNKLVYVVLFVLHASLFSCYPSRRMEHQNLSGAYTITDHTPLPFYSLYQFTTDSLRLSASIPVRYQPPAEKGMDSMRVFRLHYRMMDAKGNYTGNDSATFYFYLQRPDAGMEENITTDIYTGNPEGKMLYLKLEDLKTGDVNEQYFHLIPSWPPGRYHYLLLDHAGDPVNTIHISTDKQYRIISSIITDQSVTVRYYTDSFPVAMPPFTTVPVQYFDYAADSLFSIPFTEGKTPSLQFSKPGIYHITTDTTSRTGYTLFARSVSFPWINQSAQMVSPLRYITTTKEYDAIAKAPDLKEAVDRFWIQHAGNELRAKKLIKEYYRRIEKANYLFSSYQDGWKTDRGMIYIMYGPPNLVQRTETAEVWTYGESRHLLSLTFIFIKMNNPFTDNDYLLDRATSYKTSWYQMVNSWRR